MRRTLVLISALAVCGFSTIKGQNARMTALQSDYLEAPLGIDNPQPRLSWQMLDSRQGAKQTYYRVLVDKDSLVVVNGKGTVWDTGIVNSDARLLTYAGTSLEPFTKYYWKVIAGDMDRQEAVSPVTSFETGMMEMGNWEGLWISDGDDRVRPEAPYFRKSFTTGKTIQSARAYIAVGGLYELYINGERIGDHLLDPMFTRYDRRNLYVTYDVTEQLKKGDNAIGVLLGNGWYNHQPLTVWNFDRAPWRNRPAFCLDLRITYTDGSVETIPTDLSWKTSSGSLVYNNIYTGEHYDFRKEQEGWNKPGFDDSGWEGIVLRTVPSLNVTAQQLRPIRNVEKLVAKSLHQIDDCTYVYDFGRNISGITSITLSGDTGTEVRLKHGERLSDDGRVDLSLLIHHYMGNQEKEPFQTNVLLLSGGEDEYMTKFTYMGFRYVEITSSRPIRLEQDQLTAYFMHSDVPAVGNISTSNDLVNKIWWATNNAYLSNLVGYPTDCPQREKNGWTGDAHLAIEMALYNFDAITVYEKWMADHRDEQQPNGMLPDIIPTSGWGYDGLTNGLDWTSTIALIPWNLYLFYGDSKPLLDCYDNIKRYVDYIDRTSPNHLSTFGRGDWAFATDWSEKELSCSVYFYVDTQILAHAAKLFGKQDDYEHYSALAEKIKQAVNDKFLNRETGIYADGSQTDLCVPLFWKIVPEDMVGKVMDNLMEKVEKAGFHLDVGILGTKALLNALSENGHADIAYKIAAQDTYPSWGWWIVNGATTLYESWKGETDSQNHIMFGEVGAWFFKGLGGIFPDPEQPGFKHILLRPNFVKDLKQFAATYQSPYGEISSKWERKGNKVIYEVVIPANTTATFTLPDNVKGEERMKVLEAGTYQFRLNIGSR